MNNFYSSSSDSRSNGSVPKATGNYATNDGHFKQELVDWVAQGHDPSTVNEEHLHGCVGCQVRVVQTREEYMLREASQPSNGGALLPNKRRTNKLGRSNRRYVAAISHQI